MKNNENKVPKKYINELRALRDACGPKSNKHDQIEILIKAMIEEGFNTRAQIMSIGLELGFNRGHIAIYLSVNTGTNGPWQHDTKGKYTLNN